MKAISLFIICLLTGAVISHAQLRIAILGGAHQADVKETNELPGFEDYKKGYSPRTGVRFGFIADLPFSAGSPLSFQPGVIYMNRGRKFADSILGGSMDVYQNAKQFVNYIDIPLNLVYKIKLGGKSRFIIGGGPYASFFYNGKESRETFGPNSFFELEENEDLPVGDAPGKYKIFNYGINGLAGIEIGRVFITANYSMGLNDFYQAENYEGNFKHQTIGGTLGIFLGKSVAIVRKPGDKDKDGIKDDLDKCPELAGPAVTSGCPDKDADGIADLDDQCPDVPGTTALKGCPPPVDRDNDGVNDDVDKCPDTPGLASYEGCPIPDTDKDGINDELDKCPTVVGYGRYDGCPIPDTDGDGVNDENDKCPTEKGSKEKNGCPDISSEIIDKVNYAAKRIQFLFAKATLTPGSNKVLDEVVDIMRKNAGLNLLIEGHTSADANYAANIQLSQDRADNVKKYFISKGISASRLTARGFGPAQPLNDGKTEAEKALNRRVELKLSN